MANPIARKLYIRIWLAVAGSVLLLSLVLGWAWHRAERERERMRLLQPPREVVVRNESGERIGSAAALIRRRPGHGTEFAVTMDDGEVLNLELAPPRPTAARPRQEGTRRLLTWLRPPYGFIWLVGFAGLAVMVGVFPIARRLTQRLEALQRGVQRWGEGHLDERVPVAGSDEVADLSHHFNAAAARIEELMQGQAALLQSQKSLLANASHELRSPLARIRMALELSGVQGSPEARAEIQRNIAELDQLVDEILLASRLEAPQTDLGTMELLDLAGLVAEEAARIDAELSLAPGTSEVLVRGVSKLLRRAVRNLLENAARHGRRAGQQLAVDVSLAVLGRQAVLQVDDRGPGVAPDQRERIFEPFYRLPGASEREGGVGLGLALVRSIAQRHGGSVHCDEHPGGGARFSLRLPLADQSSTS
ncbi:MAG: ATP-binding protein [Burkholderiaceae bacterium]